MFTIQKEELKRFKLYMKRLGSALLGLVFVIATITGAMALESDGDDRVVGSPGDVIESYFVVSDADETPRITTNVGNWVFVEDPEKISARSYAYPYTIAIPPESSIGSREEVVYAQAGGEEVEISVRIDIQKPFFVKTYHFFTQGVSIGERQVKGGYLLMGLGLFIMAILTLMYIFRIK